MSFANLAMLIVPGNFGSALMACMVAAQEDISNIEAGVFTLISLMGITCLALSMVPHIRWTHRIGHSACAIASILAPFLIRGLFT